MLSTFLHLLPGLWLVCIAMVVAVCATCRVWSETKHERDVKPVAVKIEREREEKREAA